MNLSRYRQEHKSADTLFILLLLCVFATGSLLFVVYGANAYNEISQRRDSSFQRVTPLSYLASKVRQSDGASAVRTEEKDGISALVISNEDAGELCETWIYEYDGSLYELYIAQGTPFELTDGAPILKTEGLSWTVDVHGDGTRTLVLSSRDESELPMELTLSLRGDDHE